MAGFLSAVGKIAVWVAANPGTITAFGSLLLKMLQTLTGHAPATAVAEEGKRLIATFPGAPAGAPGDPV